MTRHATHKARTESGANKNTNTNTSAFGGMAVSRVAHLSSQQLENLSRSHHLAEIQVRVRVGGWVGGLWVVAPLDTIIWVT